MKAGIPAICMDGGMTLEWMQSGAVEDDMADIARRKHYVAARVFGTDAKECRVTSRYGTDFIYSVEDRIFVPPLPKPDFNAYKIINFDKDENRKGGNLYYYLFPQANIMSPPVEGSANGKLVIDLTMHHLGRLITPIELTVKQGRVTSIDGGAEARILRDYLTVYGDENAYMCPAEASVGVNAKAVIRGIQREDKNIMGAMHFGLGTNIDVGEICQIEDPYGRRGSGADALCRRRQEDRQRAIPRRHRRLKANLGWEQCHDRCTTEPGARRVPELCFSFIRLALITDSGTKPWGCLGVGISVLRLIFAPLAVRQLRDIPYCSTTM